MRRSSYRQQGFSMVELLVAMALGIALSWLVLDVYLTSSRAQAALLRNQQLNETGRYLSELLRREINSAGFYGYSAAVTEPNDGPADLCQFFDFAVANEQLSFPAAGINNSSGSLVCSDQRSSISSKESASCDAQTSLNIVPAVGTDLLVLRRVGFTPALSEATGARTINRSLSSCQHYLVSNAASVSLVKFVKGDGSNRALMGGAVWRYLEDIFYITEAGEFRRIYLDEGRYKNARTIAEGVEDFQIEYGIDTSRDGSPNLWLAEPSTPEQWASVVMINFHLLLVGDITLKTQPVKTFSYAGKQLTTTDDGLLRRLFSGSVRLASPAMRRSAP
ncbi:MAG: PilW family protein [Porticoccaceae bacterium]